MGGDPFIRLRTPPLPYYLGGGRSRYLPGDQHPNRKAIGLFDLLLVAEGTLFIGENGREWALSGGETLLLLPDGEHYAVKPCEEETVFYWLHFEHADAREENAESEAGLTPAADAQPFANPYAVRLPKRASLRDPAAAFALMDELLRQPGAQRSSAFWREQTLMLELLRQLAEGETKRTAAPSFRLAERTEAYIKRYYGAELTNETIAAALHFHPNYIVRCMKEHYGLTPMAYLQEYRLEQAKRLLIATDRPVGRIAEDVGFRYAPYFSSCFKASVGLSPARFRRKYRA